MARIVINTDILEDHFEKSGEIKLTSVDIDTPSFSVNWNDRRGSNDNVDCQYDVTVKEDLIIELEDYVHKDDVADMVEEIQLFKHDAENHKEEVDHLNESINVFKEALDIERNVSKDLEVRLKLQAETTKKYIDLYTNLISTSKPWWKLWQ